MSLNNERLLADSRLAFINRQFGKALNYALDAIKSDPKNADAYKCAANAYLSMERYEDAIQNYKNAVQCDPNNGNRYYDLGFGYASFNQTANAMNAFARAEELGCTPENMTQLYQVLGIVCFELRRFDDALINFSKSEQLLGVDMDVLRRKAVIYGIKGDIKNGLHTANEMKLVAPSDYQGYQIAVNLLFQSNRLEAAARELKMAKKYAKLNMDFYFDAITLETKRYVQDKDKRHLETALDLVEESLKTLKPKPEELIDAYINAAELNLQLEKADQTIACLAAAQAPVSAYNEHFALREQHFEEKQISEYDVEEMAAADRERIRSELGEYGLEELASRVDSREAEEYGEYTGYDDYTGLEYLTEIPADEPETVEESDRLEGPDVKPTKEKMDQILRLYIGAYTLKKDFENVIPYAQRLQASENPQIVYVGRYAEAHARRELGQPEAELQYREFIKSLRNAMIKDPTDIPAVTYRIQCNIDIGEYDEAERICGLLTEELSEPLRQKIAKARAEAIQS